MASRDSARPKLLSKLRALQVACLRTGWCSFEKDCSYVNYYNTEPWGQTRRCVPGPFANVKLKMHLLE